MFQLSLELSFTYLDIDILFVQSGIEDWEFS